jgi:hypothetical protein
MQELERRVQQAEQEFARQGTLLGWLAGLFKRRPVRPVDDPPPWAKHYRATKIGDAVWNIRARSQYGGYLELGMPNPPPPRFLKG